MRGRVILLCGLGIVAACARIDSGAGRGGPEEGGGGDGGALSDAAADPFAGVRDAASLSERDGGGAAPACGDRVVDPSLNEACDDGNQRGGDGCAADCRTVEPDFSCRVPGSPCVYLVKCGDAVIGGAERCDPPNPGKGCTAGCQLETGFVCDLPAAPPAAPPGLPPPSTCHKTVCGDGTREGQEACDDGNTTDGDLCGGSCALEPDCSAGPCVSRCGDSVKQAPEECDDGNTRDGDGCSRDCAVEAGFSCLDTAAPPLAALELLATYRDLISFPVAGAARHPDFESYAGMGVTPLLVKTVLDTDGKPAMDGRCAIAGVSAACPFDRQITSVATFADWYHDSPGRNVTVSGILTMPRLPDGSYMFDSATRGFYPIDGEGWTAAPAKEMPALADPVINDGGSHNFGFTTEIRYFFQYRGGESLIFSGDDDVWIFVNRRLALDLGGMHTRLERTLDVDRSAAALGLTVGRLYEISLFHAERHSAGSNFKLTLTGFTPTSSACRSACGDGVLAATEPCDDGNNEGGDGCSADCRHEVVIP